MNKIQNADEFLQELTKFKNIDQNLRKEIETKLVYETKEHDVNGNATEKINNLFEMMSQSISNLEKINKTNLSNKTTSTIEISKRTSIIEEIKSNLKKLVNFYEQNIVKTKIERKLSLASPKDKFEIILNFKDKQMNPIEIDQMIDNQKKKQDLMINEFSSLIKKIRQANVEIEDELQNQNPVISNLDYRVDRTKERIESTTSKLDEYLKKSSYCCLYSFISIEILVVLLLLIA